MKRWILMLMGLVLVGMAFAQPPISVQTQPPTPFQLLVVGKTVMAPTGELTFRLARPGRYPVAITVQGTKQPVNFMYVYAGKAEALSLNRQPNGSWKLVKGQQAAVQTPPSGSDTDDSFARMLADASDDQTLGSGQANLPAAPVNTTAPANAVQQHQDTVPVVRSQPSVEPLDTAIQADAEPMESPSGVIKASAEDSAQGTTAVFYDFRGEKMDTVRIFIPGPLSPEESPLAGQPVAAAPAPVVTASPVVETPAVAVNPDPSPVTAPLPANTAPDTVVARDSVAFGNPFYKAPVAEPIVAFGTGSVATNPSAPSPTAAVNPACTQLATDDEVAKLRKRMVSEGSDAGMLQLAGKAMRSKCFSVQQLQQLGVMFLNDEARYNFFEASYPRAYDPANFQQLQAQLIAPMWRQKLQQIGKP